MPSSAAGGAEPAVTQPSVRLPAGSSESAVEPPIGSNQPNVQDRGSYAPGAGNRFDSEASVAPPENDRSGSNEPDQDASGRLPGEPEPAVLSSAGLTPVDGGSLPAALSPTEALEAALTRLGPFGLYQRYTLALLLVPSALAAMHSLSYVFTADAVPFRCVVEECEGSAPEYHNQSAAALLPPDPCRRYTPGPHGAAGACDPAHYHPDTIPCQSFVYENYDTIYAEFGLACAEWRRTLVGSVRGAALPLALLLTGFLSDRFGRRTALCALAACSVLLGAAKSASINYPMFLALEFLEAALGYGFNSAAYVLMVELARPDMRAVFACASGMAYGVGGMLLAAVAHGARSWRRLLLAVHGAALPLPFYCLLLHDSARWLHAAGHRHRAAANIRKAAAWNKVALDEGEMQRLTESEVGEKARGAESAWRSAARSRRLGARLAACCWCWVAAAFVYYGLTVNSVSLAGDKYVNFALNMAMEIVASLLLAMALERAGRRASVAAAFLLCGACSVGRLVAPAGAAPAQLGLYFSGKLAITFAFNSLYVFTAELFPTATRSSALAACSLVGRLGSILAPQTPLLSAGVQAALYGACSLLAAAAALLLPETRRAALPHSVAAAERMRTRRPSPPAPPPAPHPAPRRVLSATTA